MKIALKHKGFTLVEVALVILISGILVAAASAALTTYLKQSQIKETRYRIEKIDEAILLFLNLNGRYPCAAPRNIAPDQPNFGIEINPDCNGAAIDTPATERVLGRGGRFIRIGNVPTRTLNLPDEFMFDSWGSRFTYAVSAALATNGTYNRQEGAILVVDETRPFVPAVDTVIGDAADPGQAHYVIVSHGPGRAGAVPYNGLGFGPGIACTPGVVEEENCNDDNVFTRTMVYSDANNASYYDDYVAVRASSAFGELIPSGAIMAFNRVACPDGWVEYTQARGRALIGAGDYNYSYTFPGGSSDSGTTTYPAFSTGGFSFWRGTPSEVRINSITMRPDPAAAFPPVNAARITTATPSQADNMMPYIALLYCEKT